VVWASAIARRAVLIPRQRQKDLSSILPYYPSRRSGLADFFHKLLK